MAYNPVTDFLALIRYTAGHAVLAEMPGLDYVVAAMARAGLFSLSTGQTAPVANQSTTAWLRPSQPSWVAEGTLFLWNTVTQAYELATPALWQALLNPAAATASNSFQSVVLSVAPVSALATLLAVRRAAPTATLLNLPAVAARNGVAIRVVDWSTAVVNHQITLAPTGGETIMQLSSFGLLSTADQLAGVTLIPSTDLGGWVIAP